MVTDGTCVAQLLPGILLLVSDILPYLLDHQADKLKVSWVLDFLATLLMMESAILASFWQPSPAMRTALLFLPTKPTTFGGNGNEPSRLPHLLAVAPLVA